MSMHLSVVSIEGDHLDQIAEILRACQYVIEESFVVSTGEEAAEALDWHPDRNHVAKVAYFADGWTFVIDPELVLMWEDAVLEYSRKTNTRVVAWLCEGASGSYALRVLDSGTVRRNVLAVAGEISSNDGAALPEESAADWATVWEDDVL